MTVSPFAAHALPKIIAYGCERRARVGHRLCAAHRGPRVLNAQHHPTHTAICLPAAGFLCPIHAYQATGRRRQAVGGRGQDAARVTRAREASCGSTWASSSSRFFRWPTKSVGDRLWYAVCAQRQQQRGPTAPRSVKARRRASSTAIWCSGRAAGLVARARVGGGRREAANTCHDVPFRR